MMDDQSGFDGRDSEIGDLIEIDLNFDSMRRFQAEFSQNLSDDGLFIDTGEPLSPGSVVRFRVILPEDFVFLEGTSVVEWTKSKEEVSEGPLGMALRFATLSPQNQELVAQLVQDHRDAGGTPFDIDFRPVPTDFPTDALEGAPPPASASTATSLDESYRLTVRRTQPNLEAEALRALAELEPGSAAGESPETTDADDADPDKAHGFAIVSGLPEDGSDEERDDAAGPEIASEGSTGVSAEEFDDDSKVKVEGDGEPAGEPPKLDWSVWKNDPDEVAKAVEAVEAPGGTAAPAAGEQFAEERDETFNEPTEPSPSEREFLPLSEDFDGGPAVQDDPDGEDLGSPAFDVILPENDSEPDMTPVLPDEGQDDITVTPEDDEEEPVRRRRLWPLALVAVAVLAVAGGLLWPYVQSWLEPREIPQLSDTASMVGEVAGEIGIPAGEEPVEDPTGTADPVVEDTTEVSEEEPPQETEPAARGAAEEPAGPQPGPEPDPTPIPSTTTFARADTVTAIDVESRAPGTVVRISANGSLGGGAISLENLQSPPRVLVRVRGIEHAYRPYTIESSTTEVTRVRSGLHEERRPSELWVVIDLTDPGVAVKGIDIRGSVAVLLIEQR